MLDDVLAFAGRAVPHAGMPLDVLGALTLLSIAPFVVVLTTSFVRIVVVLSLVRSALGTASLPPNVVLTGLALVLTFAIMAPTGERIMHEAVEPYARGTIAQPRMIERAVAPLAQFMQRQTRRADVLLFARIAHAGAPPPAAQVPLAVLIPAFVVGELRSAFAVGLALYLPFIAIDLAVAAILMGLGMFMLSPPVVSLPCKLLLFVMVDGWALVCGGVAASFR